MTGHVQYQGFTRMNLSFSRPKAYEPEMQTFIPERPMIQVPDFQARKTAALKHLADAEIDEPVKDTVRLLNSLPWCFTLQCCAGHFAPPGEPNQHTLERVDPQKPAAK